MSIDLSQSPRFVAIAKFANAALLLTLLVVAVFTAFGNRLGQSPEDQARFLRVVTGSLVVGLGLVLMQVRELRRQVLVMEDLLTDVRFGSGARRDRDAVDILIRALRTPDPEVRETALRTLRKLCGQDLGKDPAVWETWWKGSRATFTRASAAAPAPQK